jgi:hypothetical protein
MRKLFLVLLFLITSLSLGAQSVTITDTPLNTNGAIVPGGVLDFALVNCSQANNTLFTKDVILNASGAFSVILPETVSPISYQKTSTTCTSTPYYQVTFRNPPETSVSLTSGSFIWTKAYSFNGTTGSLQTPLSVLPTGTGIPEISKTQTTVVGPISTTHLDVPVFTGTNGQIIDSGFLISSFQPTLTLTTVGTSGAATLTGATLNVPTPSGSGSSSLSGMTATQIPVAATATTVTSSTSDPTLTGVNGTAIYPWSWYVAYGDSITFEFDGPANPSNGYAYLIGETLGVPVQNHGHNSRQTGDLEAEIYSIGCPSGSLCSSALGTNDVTFWANNSNSIANYTDEKMAELAYLAIPATAKQTAQGGAQGSASTCTYTGTWNTTTLSGWTNFSNAATATNTVEKRASSNGATVTCTVTGTTIYIGNTMQDGDTATASYTVDGGSSVSIPSVGTGGATIATDPSGIFYGPHLTRITGLSNTSHTVVITVATSSTSNYFNFDWIAGISGLPANAPTILYATPLATNPLFGQLATVAIHSGAAGTGYTVGDVITYGAGVGGNTTVATVSSGVPTSLSLNIEGTAYAIAGGTNIATSGGTGTGLKVDYTVSDHTGLYNAADASVAATLNGDGLTNIIPVLQYNALTTTYANTVVTPSTLPTGYTASGMYFDSVHPNDFGYWLEAHYWLDTLATANGLKYPALPSWLGPRLFNNISVDIGSLAVGSQTCTSITTGTQNVCLGELVGTAMTTGSGNVFAGYKTAATGTTGYTNTVGVGELVFNANTGALVGNVAVGAQTQQKAKGPGSASVGYFSMNSDQSTLGYNSSLGAFSMYCPTGAAGSYNTAIGSYSMCGLNVSATLSGDHNTANGYAAGGYNGSGAGNVFIGSLSGVTATAANANVTGSNNTWVGSGTGPSSTTQVSNTIAIGSGATVAASNTGTIGVSASTQLTLFGIISPGVVYSHAGTQLAACGATTLGWAMVSDASSLTPGTAYSVTAGAGSITVTVQCTLTGGTYAWQTM